MMASRGMGAVAPSKMPSGVRKARRDDTDFTEYKKGGKVASKNWIAGAIKHPGALREKLGAKKGEPIPAAKLEKAAKQSGKVGKQARLAETLRGLKKR